MKLRAWILASVMLALVGPQLVAGGGGVTECEPTSYGDGLNQGTLEAYGTGVIASDVELILGEPQVPDAEGYLFVSWEIDHTFVPSLGGTQLVNPDRLLMVTPSQTFQGLGTTLSETIRLPNSVGLVGNSLYVQGIIVDPADGPEPTRLTNGIHICFCAFLPDLKLGNVFLPSPVAYTEQPAQVLDHVINEGTLSSQDTTVGIYLSLDPVVDQTDQLIGERQLSGLAIGFGLPEYGSYVLPPGLLPGSYYVGAIADHRGSERELDESNNIGISQTMLEVIGEPTGLSYPGNPLTLFVGGFVAPLSPTVTGGAPQYFTIDRPLPPGLIFNSMSGNVGGVPTAVSPRQGYVITAHNPAGSVSTMLEIEVQSLVPGF